MIPVPLRRWKEDGVGALSSFLMQFDMRGLMLSGGSMFSGKSIEEKAELHGDTLFCNPSSAAD